jgi:hypothetical protein
MHETLWLFELAFDGNGSIDFQHFTDLLRLIVLILNVVRVLGYPLFREQADRWNRFDSKTTRLPVLLALWG